MNNLNCVLEALGELDDGVLERAYKPKRKKRIALIAVAAAAALSLLVGSTTVYRSPVYHNGKKLFDIVEAAYPNAVIPSIEELIEMGAYDIEPMTTPGEYTYYIKAKPSEIIKKYNLPSIISGNFSDEVTLADFTNDMNPQSVSPFLPEDDNQKLLPGTQVTVRDNFVYFKYFLVDKQNGAPIFVNATYTIHEVTPFGFQFFNGDDNRVIDLNTGEKAIIQSSGDNSAITFFAYHGVSYRITGQTDVDGMNQILIDLGITAE